VKCKLQAEILGGDAQQLKWWGEEEVSRRTKCARSHGHMHLPKMVEIQQVPVNS